MTILKQLRSDLVGVVAVSGLIHTLFCIQVFMALPGGMALTVAGFLVFAPHYLLMFFLPPSYPIHGDGVVDYAQLCGKLAVAFPALACLGAIIRIAVLALARHALKQRKP